MYVKKAPWLIDQPAGVADLIKILCEHVVFLRLLHETSCDGQK
jgi:hypothetical protein